MPMTLASIRSASVYVVFAASSKTDYFMNIGKREIILINIQCCEKRKWQIPHLEIIQGDK